MGQTDDYMNKTLRILGRDSDVWTVDDAVKGVSIIGGTGSGKTTGSGQMLAKTFLREGWGGVVLCAKPGEAKLWEEYCEETGRKNDMVIFNKGKTIDGKEPMVFNPIDYEFKRGGIGGGDTHNITNIFMNIYKMSEKIGGAGESRDERFWDTALKRLLSRVVDLLKLAKEDLSYRNMIDIITSYKNITPSDITDELTAYHKDKANYAATSKASYCLKCLMYAYHYTFNCGDRPYEEINAYDLAEEYFTNSFPSLDPKTCATITESFMGLLDPFLSGILLEHFSDANNLNPEIVYEEKKIIVLDFSIKEYLNAGIVAQSIFKLIFQQAMERRNTELYPQPVFLWGDEAQYFINSYDQIFLTTARSSRTATVYLSQNIPNYLSAMGGGQDAKAKVDSLMGNLCTKIFHANTDTVTNEYASHLIGKAIQHMQNVSEQHNPSRISNSLTQGFSSQLMHQVEPRHFTLLKTGGEQNGFKVGAIIVVSGRKWSNHKNYLETQFKQEFYNKTA